MTGEKKQAATRYHRQALMTAADRLLTEFGYDGMNMNMLAKEAKYSKATVYVYFNSKDELVLALAVERLNTLKAEVALAVKSDLADDEKLSAIGGLLREFYNDDKVYFDFICTCSNPQIEGYDKMRRLIGEITDIAATVCPVETLKRKWYEFYGRIKTSHMFNA